ncbi:MAG: hypothetical protein JWP78_139 [Mucilaginibacter sp.]|nr:hypothetical protein [Mucilaginibacter sp.]
MEIRFINSYKIGLIPASAPIQLPFLLGKQSVFLLSLHSRPGGRGLWSNQSRF